MADTDFAKDMEFPLFHHPDLQEDEVFIQYINQKEIDDGYKIVWKTIRLGKPEPDDVYGQIYPGFVKKQEIIDAGGILVPTR